jgi:CRISPR-associated protein Cmr4
MQTRINFIHALSSLHAGAGQSSGIIDLPIAREKATGIPFLPGSSLKGALRTRCITELSASEHASEQNKRLKKATYIFGPEHLDAEDTRASLAQFSDQRLLLLPVRSLAGIFAWVTSPYMLYRLADDLRAAGLQTADAEIPNITQTDTCLIANANVPARNTYSRMGNSNIQPHPLLFENSKVYLEDLDLNAQFDREFSTLAHWLGGLIFPNGSHWQQIFPQHLCLVHDNLFSFLLETATEITARIRLDQETKTVVKGALWYEEQLPAESILYGVIMATLPKNPPLKHPEIFEHLHNLMDSPIQLGGKATVGNGLCRVHMPTNGG